MTPKKVIVIGAGAAGMMCAGNAALCGGDVIIIEKNSRVGRKVMITGKGRCNVTNNCDSSAFIANVPTNGRFLYSAINSFSTQDTMDFFERNGVPLKTERGNRVFPVSDKAVDIVDALHRFIDQSACKLINDEAAALLVKDGAVYGVKTASGGKYYCDSVVIATGGKSYPLTGSTGTGYLLAKQAGHTIVEPKPSLVPIVSSDTWCKELQGLSLRNVSLTVRSKESHKEIYKDFGEMLFTHFGLSGPLVLSASAHMRHFGSKKYRVEIDLKPALDEKTLDKRLLADFDKHKNSDFINALGELLPKKLIPVVIEKSGIDPREKVNSITKAQRAALLRVLKAFPVEISGKRPIAEAIITTGGVSVREVSPKTMESKKLPHLYFAGEVLDVDAYTGGFNLQIAWSTGRLAGLSATEEES